MQLLCLHLSLSMLTPEGMSDCPLSELDAGGARGGYWIHMSRAQIAIPQEQVEAFCKLHHIRRLSLFGSVLRSDFRPSSDVDVLVEFEPGYVPGLAFFGMEEELSAILGRKVDLNTPGFLSGYFRDEVMRSSEERYVSA